MLRRGVLRASLLAPLMALIAKPAMATNSTDGESNMTSSDTQDNFQGHNPLIEQRDLLSAFAVSQLLLRERLARELHNYDEEEACYYPDAPVEVSWFKGTAADFVDSGPQY